MIIDYTHNPDSFINILTTVKEFAKRCVFLLELAVTEIGLGNLWADSRQICGLYHNNIRQSRTEDPEKIVKEIEEGIKPTGAEYICIVDRKEAIEYALRNALPGDVIILAGKGHETYQIFRDKVIHFDEREVVRDILARMDEEDKRCS